jgi:hypothetical protein
MEDVADIPFQLGGLPDLSTKAVRRKQHRMGSLSNKIIFS